MPSMRMQKMMYMYTINIIGNGTATGHVFIDVTEHVLFTLVTVEGVVLG